MGSPDASQRAAAEQWFLDRGLPSVLRPGALARRLWTRSAPALAAFAVMMAFSIVIVLFTGKHTIDIEGRPTRTQWFVLAAAMLVLPSAGVVGWLVSRIHLARSRMVASAVSVVIAVLGAIMGGPSSRIVVNPPRQRNRDRGRARADRIGRGFDPGLGGSDDRVQRRADGHAHRPRVAGRAADVLVFFNGYVWLMAAIVSRPRPWLAIACLVAIAEAFVASSTTERVQPMLSAAGQPATDDLRLADTPFAGIPSRPARRGLSRGGMWCSCSPCRRPCRSGSSQS
jgi:hypothetical protein